MLNKLSVFLFSRLLLAQIMTLHERGNTRILTSVTGKKLDVYLFCDFYDLSKYYRAALNQASEFNKLLNEALRKSVKGT